VIIIVADATEWDSLPGRLARWLPADRSRVVVVHVRPTSRELPATCESSVVLEGNGGRVVRRDEAGDPPAFVSQPLAVAQFRDASLALARLELSDSQQRQPIPREARLTELLRLREVSAEAVLETWNQSRKAFRLAAPVAAGVNGTTVDIDLRRDGPHGLIAGTTGSGKSELLQSLVVGLAARIPPDLLNFVLFDYKGGSAFREVAELPHVAGVVTDLNERLAARALASLRAELQRRERLIAESSPAATNIIEYQSVARPVPLANLVIIIDEFHRLVSEQPEFIEQMVQIAQQGRSLGVHLLLSTQKPSGVVSDHIRANTNLRICLRVTDEGDSRDVLGGVEAANIPREVPGRMYIRVGNERLRACQAGRVSGLAARPQISGRDLEARAFLPDEGLRVARAGRLAARIIPSAPVNDDDDAADDELIDERRELIDVIRAAAERQRLPRQLPPWKEALAHSLELPARTLGSKPSAVVVGRLDEPELQSQRDLEIDLDAGHICIAGGANSGKTTALLTIASALAGAWTPQEVHLYGIDFAGGGLLAINQLPHSGGVAAQHEPARVEWVLQALRDIVAERLGAGGFASPRVVVLIDNFTALWVSLQNDDSAQGAIDELTEVLDLGRAVGVTFAITMERADSLRGNLMSMFGTRLALPTLDPDALSAFGLGRITASDWIPGRVLIPGRTVHEGQLALPAMGDRTASGGVGEGGPLQIAPLPALVRYTDLLSEDASTAPLPMVLGLRQGLQPEFRHTVGEHLTVLGARRSGRSNTLAVAMMEARRAGVTTFIVANPRRSPAIKDAFEAVQAGETNVYAERDTELGRLWDQVANEIDERFRTYAAGDEAELHPLVVVIDDAETLDIPGSAVECLQRVVLRGGDVRVSLFLSAETQSLRASYPTGVIRSLLTLRSGVLLNPGAMEDFELLGVRGRPVKAGPGRGWWCEGGAKHAVQVAWRG
jgi:S-DNA-T family DNA segregation ATPase FtsK/SpoIIIE